MTATAIAGVPHEPSDEQWDAIRRDGEHLLVAASAGTGKTFTVVRKILYLMGVPMRGQTVASPLRLRDIAAITYTNKAAAELKRKLREELRAVGRRSESYEVDGARVGTIHSFCGDLLREFALRSGRAPHVALLDEAEGRRLANACVRETLLACVEDGSVGGLDALFADRSVQEVERWVGELVAHGDHLTVLAAGAASFDPSERTLVALALLARDRLGDRLVAEGSMDFDRMIMWTRDLLRDDPAVRAAVRRRIRVLVIDEFQDVDPVQREIAWLLGDPDSGRTDTTRLVLVGDPKQSIYRFRKADVTVWRDVEERFRAGAGAVVTLSQSRRSVAPVLAFVDHVVGSLLDTPLDGSAHQRFEVPHAAVTTIRADEPTHAGLEMLCVEATSGGKPHSAETVRRTEAAAMARRARQLHDADGIPWSEIAVLLAGWGSLDVYVDALRAEGIPTYALRGEGFWERREVLDVLVALEAVRSPADRRWLFGFLRGPMAGLRDESLLALVRDGSDERDLWRQRALITLTDRVEQARWTQGVRRLERWGALRDRVSAAELVETILGDTGYCAHLALLGGDDAPQRIGNVRKLVRMLALMPEATIAEVLQDIGEQRELRVREGDARLFGEGDDVVTVSSVHSAKGLEWSVVFWSDLVRGARDDDSRLLVARDRVVLGADVKRDEQSEAWKVAFELLRQERDAETRRVWYVASTRAKDLLVLSGIALGDGGRDTGSANRALKTCFPGLATGAARVRARDRREYTAQVVMLSAMEPETEAAVVVPALAAAASLTAPHEPLPAPSGGIRSSATQLMAQARCGHRHWLRHVVGLPEPRFGRDLAADADASVSAGADLSAIERGRVVHEVMEHWTQDADLAALLDGALRHHSTGVSSPGSAEGTALRRSLLAEVGFLADDPRVRTLLDHPLGRRELGFLLLEADGVAFEGAIDLIAPADGGFDVVDVKTSRCTADEAASSVHAYGRQRDLYGRVVRELTGLPVRHFTFAYSNARVLIDSAPQADVAPTVTSRAMTSDAMECRACGYRTSGWCAGVGAATIAPVPVASVDSTP
jgi:ATP-dependent helicase/nuclease subunit A